MMAAKGAEGTKVVSFLRLLWLFVAEKL